MFKSAYLVSFLALAQLASAQLDAIAKLSGKKYFGSATDNPELTDKPYVEILSDILEFGQLTPGNSMKWDATEPEQGTFNFTGGQQIVDLAHRNGQIIRGHNCVWYSQLPGWVTAGNFSASELTSIVENHCGTIVGHWSGQMSSDELTFDSDAWDVINEPFNDDGTWRSDVFYDTLGQDFVPIALKAAYNADKKAKLYINDYNIEGESAKATAMINLVKQLKADGVPINGVGLQSHFIVGEVPTTIQQNMEAMVALGIEVAITELDIRMTLPATEALLEQQAKDYESVISACHAVPGCIGVTIWDYTDKYSWVPASFPGQGAACPWDQNLKKKLAYGGIIAGFL